jgi:hypothetical protein
MSKLEYKKKEKVISQWFKLSLNGPPLVAQFELSPPFILPSDILNLLCVNNIV